MTVTAEELRALLSYDADTGIFTRRIRRGHELAGVVAGTRNEQGYWQIIITAGGVRKPYKSHRLAWLYVHGAWPANEIDHIDGDPGNNRLANLREATRSQNLANKKLEPRRNTSGFKGVSWHTQRKKWGARIKVGGVQKHLGLFDDAALAHAAYCAAAAAAWGEYANGGGSVVALGSS